MSRYAGVADLALKHEGENPTGSFKDRGMTVAVTHAVRAERRGRRLRLDRQHLGLHGRLRGAGVACRRSCSCPRARWRRASWPRRSRTARARCSCAATSTPACAWSARPPRELGITLLNSVNPWRIEGQKTIVLELLQQRGWDPPDWIVVPAGNLGNTAAFGKALREAKRARA